MGKLTYTLFVNVIARTALEAFWTKHPAAKASLAAWYAVVRHATWASFADLKLTFNSADMVGDGKVVFNVGGNNYRIIGLVGFRAKRVFILWVGTHAEYDRLDVKKL